MWLPTHLAMCRCRRGFPARGPRVGASLVETQVALALLALVGSGLIAAGRVASATVDRIRVRAVALETMQAATRQFEGSVCPGGGRSSVGWLGGRVRFRITGEGTSAGGLGVVESVWLGVPSGAPGGSLRWHVGVWCP
jgi:hypothetical protein